MTPQEFNTMDKVLGSNPVEKLSKQAVESIEIAKQQQINMPGMPTSYTPFLQTPVAEQSFLLAVDGQQYGPFTVQQIRQFLADGSITRETLAWRSGMPNWTPLNQLNGIV